MKTIWWDHSPWATKTPLDFKTYLCQKHTSRVFFFICCILITLDSILSYTNILSGKRKIGLQTYKWWHVFQVTRFQTCLWKYIKSLKSFLNRTNQALHCVWTIHGKIGNFDANWDSTLLVFVVVIWVLNAISTYLLNLKRFLKEIFSSKTFYDLYAYRKNLLDVHITCFGPKVSLYDLCAYILNQHFVLDIWPYHIRLH